MLRNEKILVMASLAWILQNCFQLDILRALAWEDLWTRSLSRRLRSTHRPVCLVFAFGGPTADRWYSRPMPFHMQRLDLPLRLSRAFRGSKIRSELSLTIPNTKWYCEILNYHSKTFVPTWTCGRSEAGNLPRSSSSVTRGIRRKPWSSFSRCFCLKDSSSSGDNLLFQLFHQNSENKRLTGGRARQNLHNRVSKL